MGCASAKAKHAQQEIVDEALQRKCNECIRVSLAKSSSNIASLMKSSSDLPLEEDFDYDSARKGHSKSSSAAASVADSTKSLRTQDTSASVRSADHTIIVLEWDDALCPTSWAHEIGIAGQGSHAHAMHQPQLKKVASGVANLLRQAKGLGTVHLVTTAYRPWVEFSCSLLMPEVGDLLQDVRVIYAMEYMSDKEIANSPRAAMAAEAKARAARAAVSSSYSRYNSQTWRNIVTIGSACTVKSKNLKKSSLCRTKMVKLLEAPSLRGMRFQLSLLEQWLIELVNAEEDVDIDLNGMAARFHAADDQHNDEDTCGPPC